MTKAVLRLRDQNTLPGNYLNANQATVGDFDGDQRDEVVLKSPAGIVVLDLDNGTTIRGVGRARYGGYLAGSWRLRRLDRLVSAGNLDSPGAQAQDELLIQSTSHLGILGIDTGGRWLARRVVSRGGALTEDEVYDPTSRVAPLADVDGDGQAELIIANGESLSAYKAVSGELGFERLTEFSADFVPSLLTNTGSPSIRARLSGGTKDWLVLPTATNWRYIDWTDERDFRQVWRDRYGHRIVGLIGELDRFIRRQTNEDRSMNTLWRDLNVMLHFKNLDHTGLDARYYVQDEIDDGSEADFDDDSSTPPVRSEIIAGQRYMPRVFSRVPASWSSDHFRWHGPRGRRSRVRVEFESQSSTSKNRFLTLAVVNDNRLKTLVEAGQSTPVHLRKEITLDVGDELAVIVTNAIDTSMYRLRFSMLDSP